MHDPFEFDIRKSKRRPCLLVPSSRDKEMQQVYRDDWGGRRCRAFAPADAPLGVKKLPPRPQSHHEPTRGVEATLQLQPREPRGLQFGGEEDLEGSRRWPA